MNRLSNRRRRLNVEALEQRSTPASGTFVEDFMDDVYPMGGYDSARDGIQIANYAPETYGARFVPTPAGGPAGYYSLNLSTNTDVPIAQYSARIANGTSLGGTAPWERVESASITVKGGGTIEFIGDKTVTIVNKAPDDQWVTYSVNSLTKNTAGALLGHIKSVRVQTNNKMFVDDLTVQVVHDPSVLREETSTVTVTRSGNTVTIAGDSNANFVRVEMPYDATGNIRVIGLAGTAIQKGSSGLTQVSPTEVEITGIARALNTNKTGANNRAITMNLGGGDDLVRVVGSSWDPSSIATILDDLTINTSSGDSVIDLANVAVVDTLTVTTGNTMDHVSVFGPTYCRSLEMRTNDGKDDVRIGTPGAHVYDGEAPGDVHIGSPWISDNSSVVMTSRFVDTGDGQDYLQVAGGDYREIDFSLGGGNDVFRLESSLGDRVTISPGLGSDLVTMKECSMRNMTFRPMDNLDVLRLARSIVGHQEIYIHGTYNITVELPASGTELRVVGESSGRALLPTHSDTELRNTLARFFEPTSRLKIAQVRFATEDF